MAKLLNRLSVSDELIFKVIEEVADKLWERIKTKSNLGYIGNHEALGIITEEYWELIEAVKLNNNDAVKAELIDVAVACWFALASMEATKEDKSAVHKSE